MIEIRFDKTLSTPICLALGFFDSVHIGHRTIISAMKESASKNNFKSAVFTFDNNMNRIFDDFDSQVYTYAERKSIFEKLGVDYVIHTEFTEAVKNIPPIDFLSVLFSDFNIKHIFCGYDYRFGCNGEGDAKLLKEFCREHNVPADINERVDFNGERVSTTRIKKLLSDGLVEEANELLEDRYFLTGKVVHGRNVGHKYGFPTANISFSGDKLLPVCGVYATYAIIDGKSFKAVTNIGDKPTFDESTVSVETLVDGLDKDIYDKDMTLEFVKRLRGIKKFSSPSELAAQIHKDIDWR